MTRNHADEAHVGQHYGIWLEEQGLDNWRDYFQSVPGQSSPRYGAWELPAELHYSTWTAERTIALIEENAQSDKPFFGWASFHDPHPPYLVSQPWSELYDPAAMEPGTLLENAVELLPEHFRLTQQKQPDYSAYQELRMAITASTAICRTKKRGAATWRFIMAWSRSWTSKLVVFWTRWTNVS